MEDRRGLNEYAAWDEAYLEYEKYINDQCSYKHYKDGTVIDFTSEYQNTFFVNGPWPSNSVYAWSGGKQNDAFFYLDNVDEAKALSLTFNFAKVYTDEVDVQNVEVYFNDYLCCQWSIDKNNVDDTYVCTVPIEYVNVDDANHLLIVYKDVQGDVLAQYQDVTKCENPYYALAYEYIQISYGY